MNFRSCTFRQIFTLFFLLGAILSLSSCKKGDTDVIAQPIAEASEINKGINIVSIDAAIDRTRIKAGKTAKITVTGLQANGQTRDVTNASSFTITPSESATIVSGGESAGLLTGAGEGTTQVTIDITYAPYSVTAIAQVGISVSDLEPTHIEVVAASENTNRACEAQHFTAKAIWESNGIVDVVDDNFTSEVTWSRSPETASLFSSVTPGMFASTTAENILYTITGKYEPTSEGANTLSGNLDVTLTPLSADMGAQLELEDSDGNQDSKTIDVLEEEVQFFAFLDLDAEEEKIDISKLVTYEITTNPDSATLSSTGLLKTKEEVGNTSVKVKASCSKLSDEFTVDITDDAIDIHIEDEDEKPTPSTRKPGDEVTLMLVIIDSEDKKEEIVASEWRKKSKTVQADFNIDFTSGEKEAVIVLDDDSDNEGKTATIEAVYKGFSYEFVINITEDGAAVTSTTSSTQ